MDNFSSIMPNCELLLCYFPGRQGISCYDCELWWCYHSGGQSTFLVMTVNCYHLFIMVIKKDAQNPHAKQMHCFIVKSLLLSVTSHFWMALNVFEEIQTLNMAQNMCLMVLKYPKNTQINVKTFVTCYGRFIVVFIAVKDCNKCVYITQFSRI